MKEFDALRAKHSYLTDNNDANVKAKCKNQGVIKILKTV